MKDVQDRVYWRAASLTPWLLLLVLSAIFCLEWYARRREIQAMHSALNGYHEELESRFHDAEDRMLALINPLRRCASSLETGLAALARRLEAPPDASSPTAQEVQSPIVVAENPLAEDSPMGRPDESLPPLPSRVHPTGLVKELDLQVFFADERFNPAKKDLAPVERLKALEVMRTGQAWMEVLDRRIQVDIAAGMEAMREEGTYIEYAQGELPDPGGTGVITAAESAGNNRFRMFYFDLAAHPEIATKKQQIEQVAEQTLRKLIQLAAN